MRTARLMHAKELQFLTEYIDRQKEQLPVLTTVTCHGLHLIGEARIAPSLLMPLIENCFQHVSRFPTGNNSIDLTCSLEDGEFRLRTSNTFNPLSRRRKGGIGLLNTCRRLQLLYPGRYMFMNGARDQRYEAFLYLKIA